MFQVLDCDRPADCNWHECHACFDHSVFKTFREAFNYVNEWLGYRPAQNLKLNMPFDYSGHGSYIEIRKI